MTGKQADRQTTNPQTASIIAQQGAPHKQIQSVQLALPQVIDGTIQQDPKNGVQVAIMHTDGSSSLAHLQTPLFQTQRHPTNSSMQVMCSGPACRTHICRREQVPCSNPPCIQLVGAVPAVLLGHAPEDCGAMAHHLKTLDPQVSSMHWIQEADSTVQQSCTNAAELHRYVCSQHHSLATAVLCTIAMRAYHTTVLSRHVHELCHVTDHKGNSSGQCNMWHITPLCTIIRIIYMCILPISQFVQAGLLP